MKKIMMLIMAVLILSACSKESEKEATEEVGFSMENGSIEEAANVPDAEKEEIINAFNTYMKMFNDENIEGYMSMLSDNPEGFKLEEEEAIVKDVFAKYNTVREAADVTIVEYDKNKTQVFTNLSINMTDSTTNVQTAVTGRQITLFVKENGSWKVSSVYFIQNTE